jgi:hypothetical protein
MDMMNTSVLELSDEQLEKVVGGCDKGCSRGYNDWDRCGYGDDHQGGYHQGGYHQGGYQRSHHHGSRHEQCHGGYYPHNHFNVC